MKSKGDLVPREMWRAKDALSAADDHDLDRLFAETRKREKLSRHPLVNLPAKPAAALLAPYFTNPCSLSQKRQSVAQGCTCWNGGLSARPSPCGPRS